jgi:hypothetical protein
MRMIIRSVPTRLKTLAERIQARLDREFTGEMVHYQSDFNELPYSIDDGQYGAIEDKTPDFIKADNQGWENL